jgi:uncharacterized membrane-anchored protein
MTRIKLFKSTALKYAVMAALPLLALFYSQIYNFAILTLGESVLLETRPVDPTDILRGDYVILDYKISDIPEGMLPEDMRGRGDDRYMYVMLERGESGIGSVKSVSADRPSGGLYIRGLFYYNWSGYTVDYGLGVYYVPEGTGREIERKINGSKALVEVRVLRGNPVIKSLQFVEITDEERRQADRQWNDDSDEDDE